MARDKSKKRRHERAAQRRQQRAKERERETAKDAGRRQQAAMAQRDRQRERAAAHPLKYITKYENGETVLGQPMPAAFLVDRIKTFGWKESLLRLAHIAAIVANDDLGPNSPRACALTADGIRSLTASTPAAQAMLARARTYVENARRLLVVAHEEALLFLQHVVILHGSDSSTDGPSDAEVAFWLLGASDHLGEWAKPDDAAMNDTERLAAELVKVHRFNRSEDSVRTALRTDGIFGAAPWQGGLSGAAWSAVQQAAFEEAFHGYFDSFVLPLFVLSHAWGSGLKDSDELPVIRAERFSAFGGEGPRFLARLKKITASRDELRGEVLKRMKPDGLLPHAPTALLHRPLVDLGEHGTLAATPWYVRNFVRTGIWNQYREAAKQIAGDRKGGDEWNRAFGQLFEEWVRTFALKVKSANGTKAQIILPSFPGAADEIEDAVLIEEGVVVMFSAKGRMVREDIARYSMSRRQLLDWYEAYLFESKNDDFRGGAIRQISARINMLRRGDFEDRGVLRKARVHPVIVTYDSLCENQMLYAWVAERCQHHGLLQQPNVGKPVFAAVQDYERLLGVAARGGSVVKLLEKRLTPMWKDERLEVILGESNAPLRLPGTELEYAELMKRMGPRIGVSPEKIEQRAAEVAKQQLR